MPSSLTDKSYRYLREKLQKGELTSGAQLVNRSLAKEIGVSMGPVREAINRLSQEGLVVHVPGAGAFVRQFDRKDVESLFVVWEMLEGCVAVESAKNAGPREIEELEEICRKWLELVREIHSRPEQTASRQQAVEWEVISGQFHETLVKTSHNKMLTKIVLEQHLLGKVLLASRNAREVITLHRAVWTWRDYATLVRAIKQRDSALAKELSDLRVRRTRKLVLGLIDLQSSQKDHHE